MGLLLLAAKLCCALPAPLRELHVVAADLDKLVTTSPVNPLNLTIVECKVSAAERGPRIPAPASDTKLDEHKIPTYAEPPPAPTHPNLTPEQAEADAAHFYSAKEDTLPYGESK